MPRIFALMPTNSTFRVQRQLIVDIISPHFMHDVAGRILHTSTLELTELWQHKIRLASGRPFDFEQDITRTLTDVAMRLVFGLDSRVIAHQTEHLAEHDQIDLPSDPNIPPAFSEVDDVMDHTATRTLLDSIHLTRNSPMPVTHLKLALALYPSLRVARKWINAMMKEQLNEAWQNRHRSFHDKRSSDGYYPSAVDLIVRKEAQMAAKENRPPKHDTPVIRDELLSVFSAMQESTGTALCWALKYLTRDPNVQDRLRTALQSAFARAMETGDVPTAQDIVKASIPYLDAFIEELLRCCTPVPVFVRIATKDTVLLGRRIPKGTNVVMPTNGPSYLSPAISLGELSQSRCYGNVKDKYGAWDQNDMREFKLERWLEGDENGGVKFNSRAGPTNPFGFGMRGCFGAKLGMVELTVIIALLVWSFEYDDVPENLSGFEAIDMVTRRPQQTYVKLERA